MKDGRSFQPKESVLNSPFTLAVYRTGTPLNKRYLCPEMMKNDHFRTSRQQSFCCFFCFGSISQVLLKILLISLSKVLSQTALEALSHRLSSFHRPFPFLSALASALCSRLWRRQQRRESGWTPAMGAVRARPSMRTSSFIQQLHIDPCWTGEKRQGNNFRH